jgi:hypothetical protein
VLNISRFAGPVKVDTSGQLVNLKVLGNRNFTTDSVGRAEKTPSEETTLEEKECAGSQKISFRGFQFYNAVQEAKA